MNQKDSKLSLKVLSPEGAIIEIDNLTAVNVPLADGGSIGVREGHAPLIAETIRGTVRYRTEQNEDEVKLHAGVLDIRNNIVTIITTGEDKEISPEGEQPSTTPYDRLMQTLIKTIQPNHNEEIT